MRAARRAIPARLGAMLAPVVQWLVMRPILRVDTYVCQTCTTCQARLVCKTRAIVQYERGDLPAIEHERCRGCMVCIPACPFGAVTREAAPGLKDG